ncbi:hypothetical protein BJY52DRAFT_73038 [Lactarius psammicola]|nr:hypothetical protein BJY52DRAFT_73038 [Lactarius psammicola]
MIVLHKPCRSSHTNTVMCFPFKQGTTAATTAVLALLGVVPVPVVWGSEEPEELRDPQDALCSVGRHAREHAAPVHVTWHRRTSSAVMVGIEVARTEVDTMTATIMLMQVPATPGRARCGVRRPRVAAADGTRRGPRSGMCEAGVCARVGRGTAARVAGAKGRGA